VDVPSPFTRIIALDFYDGPTGGVLQCAACGAVYQFDMLDWDDDHAVRVIRLASLPPGSLEACVQALGQPEPPRWPVWVPSRQALPSEEAREAADRAVASVLAHARLAELVVAWAGYGERILAARRMPASELQGVPDWFSAEDPGQLRDWFTFLGLPRRKKPAPGGVT
jgi:hypothetical protein